MKTFIKIAEIWVLNKERTQLELSNAFYYEGFDTFKGASKEKKIFLSTRLAWHSLGDGPASGD